MDGGPTRDQINIFLSYAHEDGGTHAKRFFDELSQSPRYSVEYDRRFRLSDGFDRSIEAAIAAADVMIVVLTDISAGKDWVRREILYAQRRNKSKQRIRLIVAQMTEDPEVPSSIVELPRLNFVTDPDAWTKLHADLDRESSPANGARQFDSVAGGPTDRRHATAAREATERVREERRRAEDLPGAEDRLRRRVKAEWKREQHAANAVRTDAAVRFINEMPELPEIEFQDRVPKLDELDRWLRDPATRVVLVTGDGGTGKTAFLRELRRRLADGKLTAPADSFVYLAVRGYRQVSAAALLNDLALATPDAGDLQRTIRGRRLSWRERLDAVLGALGRTPVIVAIDDAEDLLDGRGEIVDRNLRTVLTELIARPEHRVRLLLVVRERPGYPIREAFAGHVEVCDLAKGLPADHTTPFLEALDPARLLAVREMPEADLRRLAVVSDGNPRFLELTYCLLRSDPDLTLAGVFEEIDALHDDEMRDPFPLLIHAVLARLDRTDRRVVQALAVYGGPVRPEAVDHLLEAYVPGLDSAPVLAALAARALVRRDGDRYFLPPEPDVACILTSLPAGRSGDWRSVTPLFTLPFLRRRAADFYEQASRRQSVHGPDDLQPWLKQIGLRIAAGAYGVAVDLMEEIDDRYLTRWGQSGVLIRWREEVDDKIEKGTAARGRNMSYLVSALSGEEDHTGRWTARLTEVLTEPWLAKEPEDRIRFGIQLAQVQMDSGHLADAARRFDETARRCRLRTMRYEAVMARTARAVCLARLGAFDDAGREFDQARKWLPGLNGDQRAEAACVLALNEGWTLGHLGAPRARTVLEEGLEVARAAENALLTGQLLDGLAALHCDDKQVDDAVRLAVEAARIAMRTGHQGLSRNANVTLALAYLLRGDRPNAAAAVHTACQQPPGHQALGARSVEGVVQFRLGRTDVARGAFHAACTEAWLRLERAPGEFAVYDSAGIALTGLELCGEEHRLPRALDMFRVARRIAPVPGASRRAKAQLSLLEPVADQRIVEAARRAADGDDAGARRLIA